jgi:predicted nucleic acid-binding protein
LNVVLDADVLIGALDGDDLHHGQARALFRRWRRAQSATLISVVNLSEALVAQAADRLRLRTAPRRNRRARCIDPSARRSGRRRSCPASRAASDKPA